MTRPIMVALLVASLVGGQPSAAAPDSSPAAKTDATPAAASTPAPAPATTPAPPPPPTDLSVIVAAPPGTPAARLPTSALAKLDGLRHPRLSPDGRRVAFFSSINGKDSVLIANILGEAKPMRLSAPADNELVKFRWAGNDLLLVSFGKTVEWFDGDAYQTRLVAFNLTDSSMNFIGGKEEGLTGDDILWIDPEGKRILLAYQKSIYDYPGVFSVELATNKSTQVVRPMEDIWDWYADNDGTVRTGFGYTDAHHWRAVYRKDATEKFHQIAKGRDNSDNLYDVVRIVVGSDDGYVSTTDEASGLSAIYKFNFAERKRGDLVFEAPASDIEDFDTTDDGKGLLAAWYTDDRPRVKWWLPEMQTFQDQLDKAVIGKLGDAGRMARVISQSRDRSARLVWVGAGDDPGRYYYYREATGAMSLLATVADELPRAQLAKPRYVHYLARDGLSIPAYLTLPLGRAARHLPLIILPHGGPFWVRDDGSYDAEVQFLANRGYAVLQPQYRGSGSYGTAMHDKGKGQWGRAMQDDIDDGMDWLVKAGLADAARVCIVGSSYGGYAALWGATRNPERYRCAASFAGVTDVQAQVKYSNHFDDDRRSRDDWQQTVRGDKGFDLATVSPLYTVDRLKVPVLVVHGEKDQRVLPKQSKLYAEALAKAGKLHEYYTIPGEGHGFSTTAGAQLWFDKLDAFLTRYNPAEDAAQPATK